MAVECVLMIRKLHRQQIRERSLVIAAVAKRGPAAEKQQSPAPTIHELLDQLLLSGSEVIHFDAANNQPLESEQIFHLRGESRLQEFDVRIRRYLYIYFVLRGAEDA